MSSIPTILITAAAGNIGAELIHSNLLQQSVNLVLPTSNADRLRSKVASSPNVSVEEGSIKDPQWVEAIIRKHQVDTVFLCLTSHDELIIALNFLNAMERAGSVKHLVYVSALGDFASEAGSRETLRIHSAMHVVVKTTIEQKLAYSGFPWTTTVLGPSLFFTNDLRSKASMLERGFFDEPLGKAGVSRVSTSDIALAARNTLLEPHKWAGRKIMLGSLRCFTGAEVAELWSKALGRKIEMEDSFEHYESAYPEWKRQAFGLDEVMSKAWERDLRSMYQTFGEHRFGMTEEEHQLQVEVLGKQPEDYVEWVRNTASTWV